MTSEPDDVEAMRHEIDELKSQLEEAGADSVWRRRLRQLLVGAMVVLTAISLFVTVIGGWVKSQVYDTDNWVAMVGDLPQDPAIASAIADRLTDQIIAATDLQSRISNVLPDELRLISGPVTDAASGLLDGALVSVISSDQFHEVWVALNRVVHEKVVALLEGDPGRIVADDGTVYLNLLPLITRALGVVADISPDLLGGGQPVPDITADTPVDEARAELGTYLGRDLPDDFGTIAVFQSDQLAAAQAAFSAFAKLVWLAGIVTVLLAAITVWLAPNRRKAFVALGLSAVVALGLAWALVRQLVNQAVEQIADPGTEDAVRATIRAVAASLQGAVRIVIIAGAVVAIIAFLIGPSAPARWLRRQAGSLAGGARGLSEKAMAEAPQASWLAEHASGVRVGVLLAGVAAVILLPLSWFWLAVVVAMVALVELGLANVTPQEVPSSA